MVYEFSEKDKKVIKFFIDWAKDLLNTNVSLEREPFGDECLVYRFNTKEGDYFLKIKINSISSREYEKLNWLQGKTLVPRVIGFTTKDGSKALLTEALKGKSLATLGKEWTADKVIDKLVGALHLFHKTSTQGCPFDRVESGKVLIHGDACLPNFIFNGDSFSGYIDLCDSKLANIEVDLAAAIWSLQYNLGKGYGSKFLKKYGYRYTNEDTVEKLRLEYENYQKEQGFL